MAVHRMKKRSRRTAPCSRLLVAAAICSVIYVVSRLVRGLDSGSGPEGIGDRSGHRFGGMQMGKQQQHAGPRIPRAFHQVYVSSTWSLPKDVKITNPAQLAEHKFPSSTADMQTWHDVNAPHGYTYQFWDKPAMEALIKERYAEYWEAWQALPKDVERADFARYIVLHHMGGAYADGDVSCLRPIADLFHPSDALVASWEDAFTTESAAVEWKYGRQAQMVNWFLAAAPGHPALRYVMDAIKQNAGTRLFVDSARDTVERTGPGIWTEAVLDAAFKNPPSQGNLWKVRVLPKIVAGWDFPAAPKAFLVPAVFLQHNFRGSWQDDQNNGQDIQAKHPADYVMPIKQPLLLTTVPMDPSFTVLHHLPGAGDLYEGADASYSYILFGQWQPGSVVTYPLQRVERLLEGLATAAARLAPGRSSQLPALVDIGAGYGLFTLAAASRGFPVLAFEAAPKSAAALAASIEYNGFPARLVQQPLGAAAGSVCLDEKAGRDLPPTLQEAHGHGYSTIEGQGSAGCAQVVQRQLASDAVEAGLPAGVRVGAVRVAAYGCAKLVLQGLQRVLEQHRPFMVMLEWRGGSLDAAHEEGLALVPLLHWLADLGWSRVLHTGPLCRKQWAEATEGVMHRWPGTQPLDLSYAATGECAVPADKAEGRMDNFLFIQESQTEVLYIMRPLHE